MRGSGLLVPIVAIALWLAAILWPGIAAFIVVADQSPSDVEMRGGMELLLVSAAWAAAVSIVAMVIGWAPGRLLGWALARRRRSAYLPLAALLLMPICLPAYIVFFAWWQSWPAGSWLYRWAIEHGQVPLVRQGTLLLGLVCWSWPIVSWCVAGSVAATPAEREELLMLDGAGWWTRLADRVRCDGRGLLLGGLIVALAAFSNTTCFDLANVFTFGNELRAMQALGANTRDVFTASLPAMILTMAGAIVVWRLLLGRRPETAHRSGRMSRAALVITTIAWLASVATPLTLLARNLRTTAGGRSVAAQVSEYFSFYGRGLADTLSVAAVSAALAALIAIGLGWMWQSRWRGTQFAAHAMALGWFIAAALPGTMVATALAAAYNRPGLAEAVYLQPAVLILGHLARFGFLAALLGFWLAAGEPRPLRDLRAIDGAATLRGLFTTMRPRLLAAALACFAITFVLSSSEIPVTALVRPPGFDAITTSILNDMHYQRPQTVILSTGVFVILALITAGGSAGVWWMAHHARVRS